MPSVVVDPAALSMVDADFTLDASQTDRLFVSDENFAVGCSLLRACSSGNMVKVKEIVTRQPMMVTFKDYDSRTALHVAASEGRLELIQYLIENGAGANCSDRWGGSPLDDAMRHRHLDVVDFLRSHGGRHGATDLGAALILAANRGDAAEVKMLIDSAADPSYADYDKRTPLHLSCTEGHATIVSLLIAAGASVNAEDRWRYRPLDEAVQKEHHECKALVLTAGGASGAVPLGSPAGHALNGQGPGVVDALTIDTKDMTVIEKIGSGAYGDIWKCRWRGTLVAAKTLKAKEGSRHAGSVWLAPGATGRAAAAQNGGSDAAGSEVDRATALADLKIEISVLGQLRHPNICLLLGFSLADGREVMLSELMKCSLLDVCRALDVGRALPTRRSLRYAIEFAQGMNYLHTCKPAILHRDLKPANLLLDFSDTLKVSDFGLAKLRPIDAAADAAYYQPQMMTGETGSYRYMAPEVYRHERYGRPVDVYSFAMILYYLISGEAPWPLLSGPEAVELAAKKMGRPTIPRHWDEKLAQLTRSCWVDDASSRPSFAAVLEVLNEVFKRTVGTSYEDERQQRANRLGGAGCCTLS